MPSRRFDRLQDSTNSRPLSAIELLLGILIVIGHNVFYVVPSEVLILFVLGVVSPRLRNGGLSVIGLKRPASWVRVVQIALAAAILRFALGDLVVDPLTQHFWPPPAAPAGAEAISGRVTHAMLALLIVWTFAAFGEEIVYRGYLLTRAANLGKRSTAAYWAAMVVVSVIFGYGHYYKGPAGIVDSTVAGLILGAAYLLSGRNLWTSIWRMASWTLLPWWWRTSDCTRNEQTRGSPGQGQYTRIAKAEKTRTVPWQIIACSLSTTNCSGPGTKKPQSLVFAGLAL